MRRTVAAFAEGEPLDGINITPPIDVMLVLLVMFIITIPAMTHKVPIDLPQPGIDRGLPVTTHRLEIAAGGAIRLDGATTSLAALPARLAPIAADGQALLVMRTDPAARYEAFVETAAAVKRSGITRLGFEGSSRLVE